MYKLLCLGEAALRSPDGNLVHFRSRKHFALLVYLALNADRAHRREFLAGLLWSDSAESRARHSLSQALYAIRRLVNGAVRVEGEDLEMGLDGLEIDALELERRLAAGDAPSAADLYKGPFLKGFWVRGAQGFEEWTGRERARVGALAREALRKTIRSARDRCDWSNVQQRAERLVQLDPFDETAHSELMRALWMTGDRSAALEQYERLKALLTTELSTDPSTETEALAERIRQRPVRGGWSGRPMLREAEAGMFSDPPFVGRKRELAALAEEWHRVATGETRTVALVGSAGIGKTRLADEFIKSLALDDVTVVRGRCYEAEQALPYGPVAEALRQGVRSLDFGDVNPLWLAELARIVPEAYDRFGELPEPAPLDPEGGRRRLYEGIAQVLRSACEIRPVLLFLDDLHWADESSLALLHYLRRRVTNGLALLYSLRPEDLATRSAQVGKALLSLCRPPTRELPLDGLDSSESARLIASVAGGSLGPANLAILGFRADGNPFFAIELARSHSDNTQRDSHDSVLVPESIKDLVSRRFTSLSDTARSALRQAAILGARMSHETLQVATSQGQSFHATLQELSRGGIIIADDEIVEFRHDLIREIAVRQVPKPLAKVLSLRAARALVSSNGDPGEIALHFAAAGDERRAYSFALRGANVAKDVYALEESASLLELAMKYSPSAEARIDLVGRVGKLYLNMREYTKARPLLRERYESTAAVRRPTLAQFEARRDLLVVDVYSSSISIEASCEALRSLHADLKNSQLAGARLRSEILATLLWAAARSFNPSLTRETVAEIAELHKITNQEDVKCRTTKSLGIYECYRGNIQVAKTLLNSALQLATEMNDRRAILDCYIAISILLPRVIDAELAETLLTNAIPLAEQLGDPGHTSAILCNCAVCYMYLRELDHAEALLTKATETLEAHGDTPDCSPSVTYNLGFVAYLRGDLEKAQKYWSESLADCTRTGVLPIQLECFASLGLLALKRGDITRARDSAAQALRLKRRGEPLIDQRFGLEELLARVRYQAGHVDKALTSLASSSKFGRESDLPLYFVCQLTRLELLVKEGRNADALTVFNEIAETAKTFNARSWLRELDTLRRKGITTRWQ